MTTLTPAHHAHYAATIAYSICGAGGEMPADWMAKLEFMLRDRQMDLTQLLQVLIEETAERLHADRGTFYLVDYARNEVVSYIANLPEEYIIRLKIGEGVAGWVAKTNKALNVDRDDPRFAAWVDRDTGYLTESLLAVPIQGSKGVIGVIQLLNKAHGRFDAKDEEKLGSIAAQVSGLLETSSLGSQLRPGQVQPLSFRFNGIVGESAPMQQAYDRVSRAAATNATVLIRGETGSGKDLIAHAIHDNSNRRDRAFVKVDCATLPEQLIENELFGHEAGAFTSADKVADGKVTEAKGGTLFLDEIGELTLPTQAKLLRLIQDRTYMRVGGSRSFSVDTRFVFATNRNLEELLRERKYRSDLYYRMRVVEITVPPLRARGHADIARLVDYFLYKFSKRHGRPDLTLSQEARAKLHAYPWPGNVRELEHCIEAVTVLASGTVIGPDQLTMLEPQEEASEVIDDAFVTELKPLRHVELAYIKHVLDLCEGNRTMASKVLGIGRNTLIRRLKDILPV
ncbi:MAG: sigma-54-dependent Fis family transcriptional regulator [Proteobacteria bacterium]|nr:sigma-54-dependent Fis family transcriptional regulator [Pseudomonadota bacterium]